MRYLPYNKALRKRSQEMRKVPTKAEKHFWNVVLPKSKLGHYRWNRQKPLLQFIVDFYCARYKLIIEIDGDTHNSDEAFLYDKKRTDILESYGLTIIRFSNYEIYEYFNGVIEEIEKYLK